jgi:predicted transcriptional regulator
LCLREHPPIKIQDLQTVDGIDHGKMSCRLRKGAEEGIVDPSNHTAVID